VNQEVIVNGFEVLLNTEAHRTHLHLDIKLVRKMLNTFA